MPRVSVTVPCYNSEPFIAETIESVLAQTFSDFEIVVVDDGSQDRTGEIVQSFGDSRIRYFYQENQGLAKTRNRLIELAEGEYVAFLDHDDVWLPQKLERQIALFQRQAELVLVYADCYVIDVTGRIISRWSRREKLFRGWVFERLLMANFIPLATVVMKKAVFQEVGEFLPYRIAEEYDVFLKCAARYPFDYVDEPLACYRIHPGQSSKNYEIALRELVMIYEYWSQQNQGQDARMQSVLARSFARDYYNAGKAAIYLDSDPTKARRYFRQSLEHCVYWRAGLFFGLSFMHPAIVRRIRKLVTTILGYYSFSAYIEQDW